MDCARWPSTESLAKALAASSSSIDIFVQLIGDGSRSGQSVPLLGFAQAGDFGHFDERGYPAGKGWDEVALSSAAEDHAYALEISGEAMRPIYRDGDVIVVSPGTPVRRGDRVVVKTGGRRIADPGVEAADRQDAGAGIAQPWRCRTNAFGR